MKQSWIIGVVSLWLLIMTAELIATSGTAFSSTASSKINGLMSPGLVNSSSSVSALSTIFTQIGTYMVTFISAVFLWSPTIFVGNWLWFWEFVCLPISISFIIVIATIMRGVHAS